MKKLLKRKHRTKGKKGRVTGLAAVVAAVEATQAQPGKRTFNVGDTVDVHVKIKEGNKERIQIYQGVVIKAKRGTGINRSITVRKISYGVGVERVFCESSPKVAKITVVQTGRTRRAKLYYLRDLEGKAAKLDRVNEASSNSKTPASAPAAN